MIFDLTDIAHKAAGSTFGESMFDGEKDMFEDFMKLMTERMITGKIKALPEESGPLELLRELIRRKVEKE